jgi:PAS domain S-box-containing protein
MTRNRTLEQRIEELSATNAQLRRTEAALRESEDRYRRLIDDQTEAICRVRADGTILYVNEAFSRWFGGPRASWIGRPWQPATWPDDRPLIPEVLDALSPDHPIATIETRILTAGNEVRWGQFVNRAFYDETGHLIEMQSVARDITERKALEMRFAELTQELEDLYEHAPYGYHSLGPDGTFLRINATELEWLGYQRDEVVCRMNFTDVLTAAGQQLS